MVRSFCVYAGLCNRDYNCLESSLFSRIHINNSGILLLQLYSFIDYLSIMCRATSTAVTKSSCNHHTNNSSAASSSNKMPSSSAASTSAMTSSTKKKIAKPAFDGAVFDKDGNCMKHKSVQLAEQVKQDGRLLWKEIKVVSLVMP